MSKIKESNLSPIQKAHAFALVSWNGLTDEQAVEEVSKMTLEEIEAKTYAAGSISSAIAGIEGYLLKGQRMDVDALCQSGNDQYYQPFKEELARMDRQVAYAKIMKILEGIHDTWVEQNAKKYDRDREKNDKRLFQHLPTEMIGLDEVAKDLMFLAPFLQELGIDVGDIEAGKAWGSFIPTPEVATAYDTYAEKQLSTKYDTAAGMEEAVRTAIETYPSLYSGNEKDADRVAYMKERCELLTEQVEKNLNIENENVSE